MESQLKSLALVPVVSFVQVAPESVEVQMSPPNATAASFVPSEEEVIDCQLKPLALVPVVLSVHVAPEAKAREGNAPKDAVQRITIAIADGAHRRARKPGERWKFIRGRCGLL